MDIDTLFYFIRALAMLVFIYFLKKPIYIKIMLLITIISMILADLTKSEILSYLTIFLSIISILGLFLNFIINYRKKKNKNSTD